MKKIVTLLLAVLMVAFCLSMTACGKNGKTLAQIKEAGKIVIATSPDFPPFENLEGTEVVGIEIDIMKIVAEKLGVKLEIAQMDFDSVLPGVIAGKYDAGCSGITVTEKRQKNSLFTDPYCLAAQAIVVVEGSSITCKADLAGKSVSCQTATTAEEFTMANGYDVKAFASNSDAQAALTGGRVDAWVIDDLTAAEMVAVYNETAATKLVILDEAMTTEPYAFGFAFGSEDLVAEINKIIDGLVKDGTIKGLFDKYDAPYSAPEVK